MPTYDKHEHGTFSWVELGTTDANAAKKFYGQLLGWSFDDTPMGPDAVYTTCKSGGKTVCALYKMGKEMQGVPPNWLSYVTVDDVDATAKKITANGGKLVKEPFDVMDLGRMLVAQDPTGATFALWQAKKTQGAEVLRDDGAIAWNELFTNDVDRAGKFYATTIGWKTKPVDMGKMGTYTLFQRPGDDKSNAGGMMGLAPNMKGVPPHWLTYFGVADVDASTKKANELGGKTITPPMDIPNVGRFSVVQDPQGAAFALYTNAH